MNSTVGLENSRSLSEVHAKRLFVGSCFALISTSVAFAVISDILGALKGQFILTNEQVGWIGGAALWGYTISLCLFGPLCDALGMRLLLRLAFIGHICGSLTMIFAHGFGALFIGALILALGNGIVEAVCNPLIATIYPEDKTKRLNQYHVWFPGGIVMGGLLCFAIDRADLSASFSQAIVTNWQIKVALIFLPTLIYGWLFLKETFPATERCQAGISFRQMCQATFFNPFYLLILLCMTITASLELGPNRWLPDVLQSAGIPGILVLVWISGLMAVMRYYVGVVVHRLSPIGILFWSAVLAGLGLAWLSYAQSTVIVFAAATIFAAGICYFWPTMLGIVSERVPQGGALAMALLSGVGMATGGLLTIPMMGHIADRYGHEVIPRQETIVCLQQTIETYPNYIVDGDDKTNLDINHAIDHAHDILDWVKDHQELPEIKTANTLRTIIASAPDSDAAVTATNIIGPADNHGGRIAFRCVAFFAVIIIIIFGILNQRDRRKGGYQAEKI